MTRSDETIAAGASAPPMALFQPIVARLEPEFVEAGRELATALAWLHGLVALGGPLPPPDCNPLAELAAADSRLDQPLALMLQGFSREASFRPGILFPGWSDLHNHLRFAYVPAGRALLSLHSEAAIAQPSMDALMIAIGLTATLQSAPRRFRDCGQITIPAQWFPAGTAIDVWLGSRRPALALTTAYANGLARLTDLLDLAEGGAPALHNPGLRRGVLASAYLMRRLHRRMLRRTPNIAPAGITWVDRLALRWRLGAGAA